MVERLPDYIKKQMTKKQGELTIFERKSLYDFIENTSRIDAYAHFKKHIVKLFLNKKKHQFLLTTK